jgi:hypothetical protein
VIQICSFCSIQWFWVLIWQIKIDGKSSWELCVEPHKHGQKGASCRESHGTAKCQTFRPIGVKEAFQLRIRCSFSENSVELGCWFQRFSLTAGQVERHNALVFSSCSGCSYGRLKLICNEGLRRIKKESRNDYWANIESFKTRMRPNLDFETQGNGAESKNRHSQHPRTSPETWKQIGPFNPAP